MRVDVRDCGAERRYGAHGVCQREVLGSVSIRRRRRHVRREVGDGAGIQRRERRLVAEEPHPSREKRTRYVRPDRSQQAFMHKKRLDGIARCGIVDLRSRAVNRHPTTSSTRAPKHLGVEHDALRLLPIRCFFEVNRTEAVRVSHDGNARGVLDGPHEGVAPARDDKVDVSILRESCSDFRACLDGLHERGWERRAQKCGLDRACEGSGCAWGLLTALQNCSIA